MIKGIFEIISIVILSIPSSLCFAILLCIELLGLLLDGFGVILLKIGVKYHTRLTLPLLDRLMDG